MTVTVEDYGLRMRLEGFTSLDEAKAWDVSFREKLDQVAKRGKPFGMYSDGRGHKPGTEDVQQIILGAIKEFKAKGGKRGVAIVDNPITAMQMKRLALAVGNNTWIRYLDPETHPDFEKEGLAWVKNGVDPIPDKG